MGLSDIASDCVKLHDMVVSFRKCINKEIALCCFRWPGGAH